MERLTNRTKEAKSNVTIKEVCDKLADYEDLEELIGIPLKELAEIFRQHIPDDCKYPQKVTVLTDDDVDKWREYKAFEKDGRILKIPHPEESEEHCGVVQVTDYRIHAHCKYPHKLEIKFSDGTKHWYRQ